MIIKSLLSHQWKEKMRSPFWQKSIWVNILLVILYLYMILLAASIGYFADDIVKEVYKDKDIIQSFTGLLFYFFLLDLIFRFLLQKVPVISMVPYLTLPIKRSSLLHYPLLKTIPGFLNLFSLVLLLPFYFKEICPARPFFESLAWVVTVISLIAANNFLGFFLKKFFVKKPLLIFGLLVAVVATFYFDINGTISVSALFNAGFTTIGENPVLVIIPLIWAALCYSLAYLMLSRNTYISEERKVMGRFSPGFSFLSRYGEIGSLMQMELRMIFRNKRPKSIVWLSGMFLLYGFIFYTPENIDHGFILVVAGLFITSSLGLFYAQYYFAWESSYLDAYLVNRISLLNYMKSKYWLFVVLCSISYVITLPYGFFGQKILLINTSMFIYHLGVTSFLCIFFGILNRSRIDLGKSQFMNYEGASAAQYIAIIPVFGIPLFVFAICKVLGVPQFFNYVLTIMGLCGIIFNQYLLSLLARLFMLNRHKMAVAFRKK